MNLFNSSSSSTPAPAIDTPPLVVTALPQFFGAFTALGAAAIAIYQVIAGVDTTDPLKIALIGLVGVGILAWAIAATGDTIARAYASAHVTRTEPGKENQPALQAAAIRFADAYAAAHGVKPPTPAIPTDGAALVATPSNYSPSTATASQEYCFPISPVRKVKVGLNDGEAIAVKVKREGGKVTEEYLVGTPGSNYGWKIKDVVFVPPAVPSAPPTSPSGTPSDAGDTAVTANNAPVPTGSSPPPSGS